MSYSSRNSDGIIQLRKENSELKKSFFGRLLQLLPIIIPLATAYLAILQYLSNQNLIDKRKYNNAYYDERFKVLKSINKSTAEIYVILLFGKKKLTSKDTLNIRDQFIGFNYARIILNPKIATDSTLLTDMDNYELIVGRLIKIGQQTELHQIDSLNKKIVFLCGDILRHEKDSINTSNRKFFPL